MGSYGKNDQNIGNTVVNSSELFDIHLLHQRSCRRHQSFNMFLITVGIFSGAAVVSMFLL